MRITRAGANNDTFVMTSERNYQIFDGDSITMGETKVTITFNFLGKLKAIEEQLAAKEAERKAKQTTVQSTPVSSQNQPGYDNIDDDSDE